jgi:hypothetical protein
MQAKAKMLKINHLIQAFQVSAEYERKKSLRNEREAGGP